MGEMFLKELFNLKNIRLRENVKVTSTINISAIFKYEIRIYNISDLKIVMGLIKKYNINYYIMGNCSNVLFTKHFYNGVIIKVMIKSKELNVIGAIEMIPFLNSKYIEKGIASLLFLTLVPSSVGGAIYMNAGAYGSEIKDVIEYVYFYDIKKDCIKVFDKEECDFHYRDSYFKRNEVIIIGAKIKLVYMDKELLKEQYKTIIRERKNKIPYEYPSLGSIFKNFTDMSVGKLIDNLSLKGLNVGDAYISDKHGNVIVNKGICTSENILDLINIIKDKIYIEYKRLLELEIILFE